jgi:hypothetical protein
VSVRCAHWGYEDQVGIQEQEFVQVAVEPNGKWFERVGKSGQRLDAIGVGSFQQRLDDGGTLTSGLGTGEER